MRLALAPGGSVPFAHIHGDVEETFEVAASVRVEAEEASEAAAWNQARV